MEYYFKGVSAGLITLTFHQLHFFNRLFICKETLKPYYMKGLILSHLPFFPSIKVPQLKDLLLPTTHHTD